MSKRFCHAVSLLIATAFLWLPHTALAETVVAESNSTTVDTRGAGNLWISGRVINGVTQLPVADGTVTIGEPAPPAVADDGGEGPSAPPSGGVQSTTTAADGSFSLANVDLSAGSEMTITAPGLEPQTLNIERPADALALDEGDLVLSPTTELPVVEWVKPGVEGLYLDGFGLTALVEAKVNWNGNTPGNVTFTVNGSTISTRSGAGPVYSAIIDIDDDLKPYGRASDNRVRVVAAAQDSGRRSYPSEYRIAVISLPGTIANFVSLDLYQTFGPSHVGADFEFGKKQKKVSLPFIGNFGFEWGVNGSFDYGIGNGLFDSGGVIDVSIGVEGDKAMKGLRGRRPGGSANVRERLSYLLMGDKEVGVKFEGGITGIFGGDQGEIRLGEGKVSAALFEKIELAQFSVFDLFGGGVISRIAKRNDRVAASLRAISITVYLTPQLRGTITSREAPFLWEDAVLDGSLSLNAAYEPKFGRFVGKMYVGTDATVAFGLPAPVFRGVNFRVFAGYEFSYYVLGLTKELVFVDYTFPGGGGSAPPPSMLEGTRDVGNGLVLEAAANKDAGWQPMQRAWREQGKEVFLAADNGAANATAKGRVRGESRAGSDFARMTKTASPGASYSPSPKKGVEKIIASPDLPAQAELPLLENVFPNSEPSLSASGGNLMLVYLRDSGAADPLQFTEVAWTFFDGSTWSTPAAVATDSRGQFEPQVAFDGTGAAVAVWLRIKDTEFDGTEPEELAAELELVSAKWDPISKTWGGVTVLTDNHHLDYMPELAGPLTDGDLILTWRENQANYFSGEGAAGDPENTRILTRRWDAATASWGAQQVLVDEVTAELSTSLAARGGKAVFALVKDPDGDLEDDSGAELYHLTWDEVGGSWSPITRYSNDAIYDRNVKLALDASGNVYCLWQRGDDLVMDVNFSGTPEIVRPESTTAGFSDINLSVGPAGNVVVVWQEMNEIGSDAHYRVFDPASSLWSMDTLLSNDTDLERSFSTAWDPAGNLVLAYNNVEVTRQTKSVELEGGEIVEIDGVPQPGRVDLMLAKRAIVKDLSIEMDSLVSSATGPDALPGASIDLTATIRNSGNLAIEDVRVSFFDGDPDDGGILIEEVIMPGWLKASDAVATTISWTIPGPAIARTVHVVVDPNDTVTEADEENNTASLPLHAVDLQLQYISGKVLPDGSARVVARVRSLSAPESPVTLLSLQSEDGSETFVEVAISQLSPGQSVEFPLDLPPGSHPVGTRSYRLVLDADQLSGDVNLTNNEVQVGLTLWVDEDGDGLPKEWEEANGLSDSDPDDGNRDSDDDGLTDRQEYLAGTDPRDPSSVLRPGSILREETEDGLSTKLSWSSVAGRRYRVERSFDMVTWSVLRAEVIAEPPLNSITDTDVAPDGRAFYRLVLVED